MGIRPPDTVLFVKNLDHKNAITVGHTTAIDIEPTADSVDVLSFHDYNGTSRSIDANYSLADSLSKKYGKPVLQTETGWPCTSKSVRHGSRGLSEVQHGMVRV